MDNKNEKNNLFVGNTSELIKLLKGKTNGATILARTND